MPDIAYEVIALVLSLAVAAAVLAACFLNRRPVKGRHHPPRTAGPFGGPGTIGQAGCMPLPAAAPELPWPAAPGPEEWDFTMQLPRPKQPWNTEGFPVTPDVIP